MLSLRRATNNDCMLIFVWANDQNVRENSFSSDKIELEEHIHWYQSKIKDNNIHIFIVMKEDIEVGQIRVDVNNKVGTINYSIDSNYRGQGIGTEVLTLIKYEFKDIKLIGFVKKNNVASIKAFEKAGYEKIEHKDFYEYVYI